jgi:histidine kinase
MTQTEGDQVIAKVCDTGIGIPPEIADKLFEPFFTTKEVGKGTGLGLSISYGIVKDCGGQIEAISPDGQGACFKLTFKMAKTGEPLTDDETIRPSVDEKEGSLSPNGVSKPDMDPVTGR